jgi:hypothetical protein
LRRCRRCRRRAARRRRRAGARARPSGSTAWCVEARRAGEERGSVRAKQVAKALTRRCLVQRAAAAAALLWSNGTARLCTPLAALRRSCLHAAALAPHAASSARQDAAAATAVGGAAPCSLLRQRHAQAPRSSPPRRCLRPVATSARTHAPASAPELPARRRNAHVRRSGTRERSGMWRTVRVRAAPPRPPARRDAGCCATLSTCGGKASAPAGAAGSNGTLRLAPPQLSRQRCAPRCSCLQRRACVLRRLHGGAVRAAGSAHRRRAGCAASVTAAAAGRSLHPYGCAAHTTHAAAPGGACAPALRPRCAEPGAGRQKSGTAHAWRET